MNCNICGAEVFKAYFKGRLRMCEKSEIQFFGTSTGKEIWKTHTCRLFLEKKQ